MRTTRWLAVLLLASLLAACARGQDPWDTTGWEVQSIDEETDLWFPKEEPCAVPRPCPAPAPRPTPPPPHAWSGGSTPMPRTSGGAVVPPPPPPPYPLPR